MVHAAQLLAPELVHVLYVDGTVLPVGATLAASPTSHLKDRFGRAIRNLRVSITDRCNFRCTYCMPAEGLDWLPKQEILTYEEIERIIRLFVKFGIEEVRRSEERRVGKECRARWRPDQ